jgi:uncharacterized protein
MNRLARFRQNRDSFFRTHANSPLTPEQRERFSSLSYFPEDEALRFEVELDTDGVSHEPVMLGTNTGIPKEFLPAGWARIEIEGEPVHLMVFRETGRGRYFLPFRDTTAGSETYAVGRYLDPQSTPDGRVILDFNYAYSPYCAYNDRWTCPIPPRENVLSVPVRAGERDFEDARQRAASADE